MKVLIASAFAFAVFAATGPAKADSSAMYFVTVDTVGNCSVGQGKPSAGQKALGETGGYANEADADAMLEKVRNDGSTCKGVVE